MRRRFYMGLAGAAALIFLSTFISARTPDPRAPAKPETVMVTYHAKAGSEADLAKVLARQWATGRNLKLFVDAPHLLVRGVEAGNKPYFVEILTWRDASVPDAPPDAIRTLWGEMNKLVESRGGRPGIEIAQVTLVAE